MHVVSKHRRGVAPFGCNNTWLPMMGPLHACSMCQGTMQVAPPLLHGELAVFVTHISGRFPSTAPATATVNALCRRRHILHRCSCCHCQCVTISLVVLPQALPAATVALSAGPESDCGVLHFMCCAATHSLYAHSSCSTHS
jgi:hypothetical protein